MQHWRLKSARALSVRGCEVPSHIVSTETPQVIETRTDTEMPERTFSYIFTTPPRISPQIIEIIERKIKKKT